MFVVENLLIKEYFDHYLTYVIALRLLCKERVSSEDIKCAFSLLNYFVMRFEKLYGIEHTTFKIHSLTHLATQVLNFGPLHKHAVFHFEGFF